MLILSRGDWQEAQMLFRMLTDDELLDGVECVSAGSQPKPELNPWVIKGMELKYQSVVKQFPKHVSHFKNQYFDVIICCNGDLGLEIANYSLQYSLKINLIADFDINFVHSIQNVEQFDETYFSLQKVIPNLVSLINS